MGCVYDDRTLRSNQTALDDLLRRRLQKQDIRHLLLERIDPEQMLMYMSNSISQLTKQSIVATQNNEGRLVAADKFLEKIPGFHGWGFEFLDALHNTGLENVAIQIDPEYRPIER